MNTKLIGLVLISLGIGAINADSSLDKAFACVQDGLFAATAFHCKKYYICLYTNTAHALKKIYSCPPGFLFDEDAQFCNWASKVTCNDSPATTTAITTTSEIIPDSTTLPLPPVSTTTAPIITFKCKQDGLFGAVEYNCQKYYQCFNTNTPFASQQIVSCPANLFFDTKLQYCTFSHIVQCDDFNFETTYSSNYVASTTTTSLSTDDTTSDDTTSQIDTTQYINVDSTTGAVVTTTQILVMKNIKLIKLNRT